MKTIVQRIRVRPVITRRNVEAMFGVDVEKIIPESYRDNPYVNQTDNYWRVTVVFHVHTLNKRAFIEWLKPDPGRRMCRPW